MIPFFHHILYYSAARRKILMNLFICYPKYAQSKRFRIGCPFFIVFPCFLIIMLPTINFYDEFKFRTIKINDIISNHILTIKLISTSPQKIVPQMPFLRCHMASQILSPFCQDLGHRRPILNHKQLLRKINMIPASFLWKAEILQRISEPGSYLSIACTQSEHLNARP